MTLVRMVSAAPDALTADMMRFYRLDMTRPVPQTRILWLADLAANLPEEASVWRRLDPRLAWTTTQQLLANIADATGFAAWTKTDDAYHGGTWHGAIKRPGAARQRAYSFADVRRMLAATYRHKASKE